MVSPNFFKNANTSRDILLLEASRKVVGAPDVALAMREHVWRWFASVGTTNAQSDRRLQIQSKSSSMRGGISAFRSCRVLASVADAEIRE